MDKNIKKAILYGLRKALQDKLREASNRLTIIIDEGYFNVSVSSGNTYNQSKVRELLRDTKSTIAEIESLSAIFWQISNDELDLKDK
jgi:hypothetical protein